MGYFHKPETLDAVEQLWNAGKSASAIAAEIGKTRNAVIGIVTRLKKQGRQMRVHGPENAGTKHTAQRVKAALDGVVLDLPPAFRVNRAPGQQVADAAPAPTPPASDPEPLRLTIFKLTDRTCKWPLGGWNDRAKFFCGLETGGKPPYCEHHRRKARTSRQTPA